MMKALVAILVIAIALCLTVSVNAATVTGQSHHKNVRTHHSKTHPLLIWCISRQMHSKAHLTRMRAERWCIANHQY
jgi:hypothetical protein